MKNYTQLKNMVLRLTKAGIKPAYAVELVANSYGVPKATLAKKVMGA